ncbi:MAG: MurR/RpiR family transcriptional regulator [Eubacteriaceae bacterium]
MEDKNSIDIIQKLKNDYVNLSKSHKLIADYLLLNYEKAAFMTASRLGEMTGVSEATVVRFANNLGFDGYPKFKRALQNIIKTKLTTIQRIDMSQKKLNNRCLIKNILNSDIDNIRYTLEEFNEINFERVVDLVVNANNIYIVGFRTTTILTEYLGYYLNLILDNVKVINNGVGDIYEQTIRAKEGDLVIGVSFPRYSAKTYETIEYLKEKGLNIVAITDNEMSPITKLCEYYLIAKSNIISFVDTLVAPLSLLNALIIAVGLRNEDKTKKIFNELEKVWAEHYIYAKEE